MPGTDMKDNVLTLSAHQVSHLIRASEADKQDRMTQDTGQVRWQVGVKLSGRAENGV